MRPLAESELVGEIAAALELYVDVGSLAGAAVVVWQDGAVICRLCPGCRDLETRLPVQPDTIYRIASMSKPVTSVAAMMLLEEGRFVLDEPIANWAPEFAEMRVLRSPNGALDDTEPALRSITFDDLLSHRSGITYGELQRGPIAKAYAEQLGRNIDSDLRPDDWIAKLAALPLIDQPGAAFHYGHSTDLLGLLIARMEGTTLGELLQRRIFAPLGMNNTSFQVPADKWARRARSHGFDESGRLTTLCTVPGEHALNERSEDLMFESGGQGLWSTLDDYLLFARLFVEGGAVNGVRLLQPETLALMTANRLTPQQRMVSEMFGVPVFAAGHGFGLGVAVVMEPEQADPALCGGGVGAVGWPGAYGGWWQADPNDRSVLLFLTHSMVELDQLAAGICIDVWAAITEFQSSASKLLDSNGMARAGR